MYILIVGAGDTGTPLIEMATEDGNEVAVVERNHERAERAASNYDCLVVEDDATSMETLLDAGADRADALITTTDEDATNVMACLLGQELEVPNIVSVVHDPDHMNLYEQIGVNVVENPQQLIADYLYRAITRPSIVDFMRVGEAAEVFEIEVEPDAPIADMTLAEAGEESVIPEDLLIVAVDREGEGDPITPRGDTRIDAGDVLTVYASEGATPSVLSLFGHDEHE
jgi:trk system potassium uptake protein TrkA